MEKRFSLENVVLETKNTLQRFPLAILVAVTGTVTGLFLIHNQDSVFLIKLLASLLLTFPLFVGTTLFVEQANSSKVKIISFSVVTLFSLCYFFFLAKDFLVSAHYKDYIQYLLWIVAVVLSVTFAPFIQRGVQKSLDFWFYNQRFLYALLTTVMYSVVIYVGLSVAMLSTGFLFDININEMRWVELWIVTVGIFSTTFFLSRYPAIQRDEATLYPKELKKFSYYVLTPLVFLYFVILYSYTFKIVASWEWPKGIISYMILGFSALGILTYIFLYPLILQENKLQKFGKAFFIVLLPQIAVLFFAVWLRVSEYGITENRYLLIVFGCWLLATSLYFLFGTIKNISLIPISLFILLLIISFGPWGMFSVSQYSQIHRLKNILERNGMLVNGNVKKAGSHVSLEDQKEIGEIIYYVYRSDNLQEIQPWFKEDLGKLIVSPCDISSKTCPSIPRQINDLLGIETIDTTHNTEDYMRIYSKENLDVRTLKVAGYDYLAVADENTTDGYVNGAHYHFSLDVESFVYTVYKNNKAIAGVPLRNFFSKLSDAYAKTNQSEVPLEELSFVFENKDIKMKVYFTSINDSPQGMNIHQEILYSVR